MKNTTLSILLAITGLFSAGALAQKQTTTCEMSFAVRTDTVILFSRGVGRGVV